MRVLFLTHRLPYAPNRGDRIRAYYLLRELSRFADVSLFSLVHDDEEAARAADVPFARVTRVARVGRWANAFRGALSLPTRRPLTHALLDAPGATGAIERLVAEAAPDVTLAFCSGMARFCLEPPLRDRPFVLDMVDVDSAKWRNLSHSGPRLLRPIYRREAATLGAFEATAARRARRTLVVNARERDALLALAPDAAVEVVENGIDVDGFRPAAPLPDPPPTVIFCGVMSYYPNDEAVRWFARDVWPAVLARRPDARFVVVGSDPSRSLRQLAERTPSIEVTGRVPDVQPYLWRAAVSVAPLRTARGVQNKVLEALAAELPVVATPEVWDGLPPEATGGCRRATSATDFAGTVLHLLDQPVSARRQIAKSARLDELAWNRRLASLEQILRTATNQTPR